MRVLSVIALLGSLSTFAFADDITLNGVRKIYLEKMPNDLDQYIAAELAKQLQGRIVVVLQKEDADAILRGTGDQKTGVGAAVTGRYLGLHDNATGSVSLLDKEEKVMLWSSEAGDRSLWKGFMARGGLRKVADRLVHDLKDAIGKSRPVQAAASSGVVPGRAVAPPPPPFPPPISASTMVPSAAPAAALPSLASRYKVPTGSVLTIVQQDDVAQASFTYATGVVYASARLQWNPKLSAFAGSGTITMACDKTTVDTPFMVQITVVNDTTIRERYTKPQQVNCQTGVPKGFESEELVWAVVESK